MTTLRGILDGSVVVPELEADDKESVIEELVGVLKTAGRIDDDQESALLEGIFERESKGTTGIGRGLAIPHVKESPAIQEMVGAFGRSTPGIDFESLDGEPAHLFFLLCSPEGADPKGHQQLLMQVTKLAQNDRYRRFLMNAGDAEELVSTLEEAAEEV